MKQFLFDHFWLINAFLFIAVVILKTKNSLRKSKIESEKFIDKWYEEHIDMLVDHNGELYMVFDKKEIIYLDEEKLF